MAFEIPHVSAICAGAVELRDSETLEIWEPLLLALEAGAWLAWPAHKEVAYVPLPMVRHVRGVPHCDDGPAFVSLDLTMWFLRGVEVDEQIVLRPETQTVEQIRGEKNEEVKRHRIERYGWPRYLTAINASRIHTRRNDIEGTRESLYRADGAAVLVCACPSTARVYALECPPDVETCEQAQSFLSSGLNGRIISSS